ncbi:alpha/beta hydrolase [Amycolatopsis solani]|uniref:alpha/beta hydrolase n=1 Tax=Amycolatopsis solani TaxID=3028615 RepID=UPI0025B26F02|nr:alpha/beta hydrolase [Amycolatopsis sp. MEP2-6]
MAIAGTLALTACSDSSTTMTATSTPAACPVGPGVGGGPPAGASLPSGKLVVPVDTSTSTVLDAATAPQIRCGRVQVDTKTDIVYAAPALPDGRNKQLAMDVQTPRTPGPKPLVVYVPGGGFVQSAKEGNLLLRTYAAEAGYVVASIQYRTQPDGATYADSIADVKSAIRYLEAHASTYGIAPGQVGVWGDSAGGYLAAMVGVTTGNRSYDVGENLDQTSDVQAIVDKFGASDLSRLASDFDAASQQAMAGMLAIAAKYVSGPDSSQSLADNPAGVAAANPVTHIKAGAPPFVLFHGNADTLISPSQTLLLHNALRAAGVPSTRYVVDGGGHGDLAFTGDTKAAAVWTTTTVADPLIGFLNATLRK